jgi:hypothetical protein
MFIRKMSTWEDVFLGSVYLGDVNLRCVCWGVVHLQFEMCLFKWLQLRAFLPEEGLSGEGQP